MIKSIILTKVFTGFLIGIVISICLVGIYIMLIEPIIMTFTWKNIIKNKEKLSIKEQKIIKYIQLFSFWDIDKYNYIKNKEVLYMNYDYLCKHTSENINETFYQLLYLLNNMKDSDVRNDVMINFEKLYDIEDLTLLESLDNYLDNKIEYLVNSKDSLDNQHEISKENRILNTLKEKLIKLNQFKFYSIINTYYISEIISLNDLSNLTNVITKNMNELELRQYINSIILNKENRYNDKSQKESR